MGKEKTAQERCRESVPALLQWYAYNARVLPWRDDPVPYHVWISEIMLQQTRVEAVRGYYDRFLADLPTVRAVAEAQEDRLIKLWEGLGYYSRVRNIGKAAKVICERYGGELPADYALLRELPGIGDYTAGAIASISFGQCVPAVDGNVLRVYARLTAYRDDIRSESYKKQVREMLTDAMEAGMRGSKTKDTTPGRFNQAVMDIGATVCIPNGKPHCDVCPLSHLCKAYAEGLTGEIPRKAEKKARPVRQRTVMVIRCNDHFLLHRRPQSGLLAGMWELPNVDGHLSAAGVKKAASAILSEAGMSGDVALSAHRIDDSRHVFSHVEWEMRGYRIDVADEHREEFAAPKEYAWMTSAEITETVGLPQAFRAYKLQL
ncbi:MAG: A/G-specific adenine glycosylase [Lachnospiraceae bacterium]|nr:A/G-specific adenine glycosylase [Lachnospiraceae bacterium]